MSTEHKVVHLFCLVDQTVAIAYSVFLPSLSIRTCVCSSLVLDYSSQLGLGVRQAPSLLSADTGMCVSGASQMSNTLFTC